MSFQSGKSELGYFFQDASSIIFLSLVDNVLLTHFKNASIDAQRARRIEKSRKGVIEIRIITNFTQVWL